MVGERYIMATWGLPLIASIVPNARWRGSQGYLLCSSGCHRFANFQSYRFIVAALSDLQLIAAKPPSGPALPGLGGVDLFLPRLSPEALAEDKADHVFLMVDMVVVQTLEVEPIRGLEVALDHAASTAFQISGAVLCLTRSLSSLN